MTTADPASFLAAVTQVLRRQWPDNRTVNIVCHGHSVPAGYFATPRVDALHAYPQRLYRGLLERFPFAVVNVIVTAIGGENSSAGAARFARDVLSHRPDVVTLDYGLNDRGLAPQAAAANWRTMLAAARDAGAAVLLLTPTWDQTQASPDAATRRPLVDMAAMVRDLAGEHGVGLADSYAAWGRYVDGGGALSDLLSWSNHPNRRGHELVARELLRWFPAA